MSVSTVKTDNLPTIFRVQGIGADTPLNVRDSERVSGRMVRLGGGLLLSELESSVLIKGRGAACLTRPALSSHQRSSPRIGLERARMPHNAPPTPNLGNGTLDARQRRQRHDGWAAAGLLSPPAGSFLCPAPPPLRCHRRIPPFGCKTTK